MAIIFATRMPRSRAISLSCAVACIFLPEHRLFEEEVLEDEQGQGAHDDHDVLGVHEHPEHVQRRRRSVGRGISSGSAPKTICAPFFRKMETPMVLMMTGRKVRFRNGIVGDALEDDAEDPHEDGGDQIGQGIGDIEDLHEPHGHEGRDHHKLALGEVHDVHGVEDQDETQGDQGVNGAHRQARGHHLQIGRPSPFRMPPRCAPAPASIAAGDQDAHSGSMSCSRGDYFGPTLTILRSLGLPFSIWTTLTSLRPSPFGVKEKVPRTPLYPWVARMASRILARSSPAFLMALARIFRPS